MGLLWFTQVRTHQIMVRITWSDSDQASIILGLSCAQHVVHTCILFHYLIEFVLKIS